MGGALGGVVPDIDIVTLDNRYHNNEYKYDAIIGQLLSLATASGVILLDYFNNYGILERLIRNNINLCIGAVIYLLLLVVGYESKHGAPHIYTFFSVIGFIFKCYIYVFTMFSNSIRIGILISFMLRYPK